MSENYQPLYLKYRPQSLMDLVGQSSVAQTLKNAIDNDRICHAYLFTGPRGTGKTSSARILAKSLNCQTGMTPTPCLECTSCIEIKQSNSPAVFEIDAASNNSVDDARRLIERAPLVSQGGRFKLYIIDECHMLTKDAFNALLKTIEEPPPKVVFILATTEEHKVPATIISRCQRLMFRLVNQNELVAHLRKIADMEKIEITQDALELVARRSSGGLRDALGLLDQASLLAQPGKPVEIQDMLTMLGAVHEDVLMRISQGVLERNAQLVLESAHTLMMEGREPALIAAELAKHFLNLAKASYMGAVKQGPDETLSLILGSSGYLKNLADQAPKFERSELSQIVEQLDALEQACRKSSQPSLNLEIGLVSLCHRHDMLLIKELSNRVSQLEAELFDNGRSSSPGKPRPAIAAAPQQQTHTTSYQQSAPQRQPSSPAQSAAPTQSATPAHQPAHSMPAAYSAPQERLPATAAMTSSRPAAATVADANSVQAAPSSSVALAPLTSTEAAPENDDDADSDDLITSEAELVKEQNDETEEAITDTADGAEGESEPPPFVPDPNQISLFTESAPQSNGLTPPAPTPEAAPPAASLAPPNPDPHSTPAEPQSVAATVSANPALAPQTVAAPSPAPAPQPVAAVSDPRQESDNRVALEELWDNLLEELQRRHLPTYSLVSSQSFPLALDKNDLTIGVKAEHLQKMMENKGEHIKSAGTAVTGKPMNLKVKVVNQNSAGRAPAPAQPSPRAKKTAAPGDASDEGDGASYPPPQPQSASPQSQSAPSPSSNRPSTAEPPQRSERSSADERGDKNQSYGAPKARPAAPAKLTPSAPPGVNLNEPSLINDAYKLFQGPGSRLIT